MVESRLRLADAVTSMGALKVQTPALATSAQFPTQTVRLPQPAGLISNLPPLERQAVPLPRTTMVLLIRRR